MFDILMVDSKQVILEMLEVARKKVRVLSRDQRETIQHHAEETKVLGSNRGEFTTMVAAEILRSACALENEKG